MCGPKRLQAPAKGVKACIQRSGLKCLAGNGADHGERVPNPVLMRRRCSWALTWSVTLEPSTKRPETSTVRVENALIDEVDIERPRHLAISKCQQAKNRGGHADDPGPGRTWLRLLRSPQPAPGRRLTKQGSAIRRQSEWPCRSDRSSGRHRLRAPGGWAGELARPSPANVLFILWSAAWVGEGKACPPP